MARPDSEPKTPLAKRLRKIRKMFGNEERGAFAKSLGLAKNTLANYELGASEPQASIIMAYHTIYSVDVRWILTGEGEMFTDVARAKAAGFKPQPIPAGLTKKLERVAHTIYRDAKIELSPEKLAQLVEELSRKLQELVQNINDKEEVEATLPLLKLHLKRQVKAKK
ncbi:helix-turn-helix domain-containing protein [Bartonella sp. CB178]|uniref:helix-turn-helix domain-containing protein n=1 Tax=Bartonella sp. CB178 TaxID=3112255 RepID=UPI00300E005E